MESRFYFQPSDREAHHVVEDQDAGHDTHQPNLSAGRRLTQFLSHPFQSSSASQNAPQSKRISPDITTIMKPSENSQLGHRHPSLSFTPYGILGYPEGFSSSALDPTMIVPKAQPSVIIQNLTKTETQSKASQTSVGPVLPPLSKRQSIYDLLEQIWSSRLNRLIIFGIIGSSVYFAWDYARHQQKMDLRRRRIASNPLLRLSDRIGKQAGRKYS